MSLFIPASSASVNRSYTRAWKARSGTPRCRHRSTVTRSISTKLTPGDSGANRIEDPITVSVQVTPVEQGRHHRRQRSDHRRQQVTEFYQHRSFLPVADEGRVLIIGAQTHTDSLTELPPEPGEAQRMGDQTHVPD